ncbi:hypothetical protein [Nocardioides panaciterrulae]|uniref:Cytochrome c5 n=1 Tax=Nocardioides panaciterrulae TaxID=661492 RepID=A0A7Y9E779_9ACTN|nr:hypothetical protein [Nocardioides panaciterrulae]NYD42257.1 cytochrome c5 [Nocardioides panaciterrulae]
MTRIGPLRRGLLLATGLLVAAGGSLTAATAATATADAAGTPAAPHAAATAPAAATAASGQRTTVAFLVDGCNRCHVRLYQAVRGRQHVWESRAHRVREGRVSFDIATRHTHGLSASVTAPWEGNTGAVTQIAFRYAHEPVDAQVTNREASHKHRASGCWAGTTRTAALLDLTVRRVRVPGVDGSPTTAARAWIATTVPWWKPMLHAYRGILGAQDVIFCERP